jgi:hypothetical protein
LDLSILTWEGNSYRYSLTGNFELNNWQLGLYASSYYMSLINNPTYILNNPVQGDEFEQEDKRALFGGSLRNEHEGELFGIPVTGRIGSDIRFDDVGELNLFNTVSRTRDRQHSRRRGRGVEYRCIR